MCINYEKDVHEGGPRVQEPNFRDLLRNAAYEIHATYEPHTEALSDYPSG